MRTVMLDTDALDAISTMPELYRALRDAMNEGTVEVVLTHVQIDQTIVMADKRPTDEQRRKRGHILSLLHKLPSVRHINTAGVIVGLSRLDMANIDNALAVEMTSGPEFATNGSNVVDVLLVHTAAAVGAEFISADTRARNYARGRGLVSMTPAELFESL